MRVLLVDDNQPFRTMLRHTLESSGVKVCAEAGDADTALAEAHRQEPDLVLLDLNLPGGGLNVLARLTGELPRTTVVVLTARDDDHAVLASLRHGAAGYVLKGSDPWELPAVLEDAAAGGPVLSPKAIGRLIGDIRRGREVRSRAGRHVGLSDAEWDVVSRLREGRSTHEIAAELSIEPELVRRHVSSVLGKLSGSTSEHEPGLHEEIVEGRSAS